VKTRSELLKVMIGIFVALRGKRLVFGSRCTQTFGMAYVLGGARREGCG